MSVLCVCSLNVDVSRGDVVSVLFTRRAAQLAKRYPKVNVDPEPIWAQDENFYASAGVTAGIVLSLALLENRPRLA